MKTKINITKIFFYILLFFPSVTFGLLRAEVFPYAIIIYFIFNKSIRYDFFVFIYLLLISSYICFIKGGEIGEIVRSLAAYINPLCAFYFVLSLDNKDITCLKNVSKIVFIFLIILGVFQYTKSIDFLEPIFKFLVPRSSSSILGAKRGVTLLSTEPARAGVELIFLYLFIRESYLTKNIYKITFDILFFFYSIFVIKSAMSSILLLFAIVIIYNIKLVPLVLLIIPLIPLLLKIDNNRTVSLFTKILSLPLDRILFELINTSGNRIISIISFYPYGIRHLFGGNVGNWQNSSITAVMESKIDTGTLNWFTYQGYYQLKSFRASGYITNLILDTGLIGVFIFFCNLIRVIKPYKNTINYILVIFIFNILFIGSVGTTIPWIIFALFLKY